MEVDYLENLKSKINSILQEEFRGNINIIPSPTTVPLPTNILNPAPSQTLISFKQDYTLVMLFIILIVGILIGAWVTQFMFDSDESIESLSESLSTKSVK